MKVGQVHARKRKNCQGRHTQMWLLTYIPICVAELLYLFQCELKKKKLKIWNEDFVEHNLSNKGSSVWSSARLMSDFVLCKCFLNWKHTEIFCPPMTKHTCVWGLWNLVLNIKARVATVGKAAPSVGLGHPAYRCGVTASVCICMLYPTHQQHEPLVKHLHQHLADGNLLVSWEEQCHTFCPGPKLHTRYQICTCKPRQR